MENTDNICGNGKKLFLADFIIHIDNYDVIKHRTICAVDLNDFERIGKLYAKEFWGPNAVGHGDIWHPSEDEEDSVSIEFDGGGEETPSEIVKDLMYPFRFDYGKQRR